MQVMRRNTNTGRFLHREQCLSNNTNTPFGLLFILMPCHLWPCENHLLFWKYDPVGPFNDGSVIADNTEWYYNCTFAVPVQIRNICRLWEPPVEQMTNNIVQMPWWFFSFTHQYLKSYNLTSHAINALYTNNYCHVLLNNRIIYYIIWALDSWCFPFALL